MTYKPIDWDELKADMKKAVAQVFAEFDAAGTVTTFQMDGYPTIEIGNVNDPLPEGTIVVDMPLERRAYRAEDMPAEVMAAIAEAEVPAEYRYLDALMDEEPVHPVINAINVMREPDALSTMPINRIREMAQPEADGRLDRGARRESRRSGRAEGVGERPVRRHACLLPGYDK